MTTAAIRTTDFEEYHYAVTPYLAKRDNHSIYRSRHGFVDVFVYPSKHSGSYHYPGHTSLGFIQGGRSYHRTWRRDWPPRTLARLAREFADSVVAR